MCSCTSFTLGAFLQCPSKYWGQKFTGNVPIVPLDGRVSIAGPLGNMTSFNHCVIVLTVLSARRDTKTMNNKEHNIKEGSKHG